MSTMLHRLHEWAQETPEAPAQLLKDGNEWKTITARQYRDRVHYLALYLESKGFEAGSVSAILSYNRPHWHHMEFAPVLLGGQSAGLYPNASQKDIDYILNLVEASVLSVQNEDYYKRIIGDGTGKVPESVKLILVFEGGADFHPNAVRYDEALDEGRKIAEAHPDKTFDSYLDRLDPKAGSMMIFTSGTTGNPKGAVLSQENLVFTSDVIVDHWEIPQGGTAFSFLPICHIAEKLHSIGVALTCRTAVHYCSSFDKLPVELVEVQPTIFLAVPRVWEKFMEGVSAKLEAATGVKAALAKWALGVGRRVAEARYSHKSPSAADQIQLKLAEKLVLGKVRHAIGLFNKPMAASGAAPLNAEVARWFRALGVDIYEDYGQTESTGMICLTVPGEDCAGTVGIPAPRTEFKLAEDGEILTKGRHVFLGYFKNEEATRDTIQDGWLLTGDLGKWTDEGYIRIVGRKKEIMKTSGGKMTAPAPIEEEVKISPLISQVCMVGDGRKYFSALVTLSEDRLARLKEKPGAVNGKTVTDSETIDQVKSVIDRVNGQLAGYEQIKYFKILAREFSVEEEEMTPTMKMKRNVVEDHFSDVIESMYR